MTYVERFKRLLLSLVLLVTLPAHAGVVVFGDSLSDSGNVYSASIASGLQPDPIVPPFYMGRMSNGPNWADLVSQQLGFGLTAPSNLGGNNYAWAGATSGTGTTNRSSIVRPGQVQPVDNVGKQIQTFATSHPGGLAANDWVLYWAGANDILAYTLGGVPVGNAVANLLGLTAANLKAIEALGATKIVLPNQIDSGKAPIWNGSFGLPAAARPYITAVTTQFNAGLVGLIADLQSSADFEAQIFLVDEFSRAEAAIANPAAFGLTNVTDLAFPANIPGAGSYLFWDPIHPTATGHRMIANAVIAAIPEPGVLALVGVGLALLVMFGRARDRRAGMQRGA